MAVLVLACRHPELIPAQRDGLSSDCAEKALTAQPENLVEHTAAGGVGISGATA